MKGKLYLVATPIGNLEDITLRAIKTLKEVDIIAAEDTRHTLQLLNHLEITKPLISYHRHNEEEKSDNLINILLDGKNIALVSDAGTPVISDPGEEIVKKAIEKNIEIIPIPGACALITALISSGLNSKEFTFIGFLPLNKKLRKQKLEEIKKSTKTIILYEAPHKIKNTLEDLAKIAQELINKLEEPKGEFVIIIEENCINNEEKILNNLTLEEHYNFYKEQGLEKKEIIKKIAKDRNTNKNEIYKNFI